MEDHFWPSLYPGLIVGALIGLSAGTLRATLLGALGGFGGAFAGFALADALSAEPGLLPLAAIILGAAGGARIVMFAGLRIFGRSVGGPG